MDVSYKWLKELVDIDVPMEEYEKRMILAGFEVEGIKKLIDNIHNVIVGKITRIEKHPDADKLQICMLDVGGEEEVQIVTGATNVFEGAVVPVAMIGAALPDGTVIKKGKLRGVESRGMLCGGEELGFDKLNIKNAQVDGILILEGDYTLGEDILSALNLVDDIIEFSITSNRSDCMSMVGIAMESGAVLDSQTHIERYDSIAGDGNDPLQVTVQDTDLCPRYMAAVIDNIKVAPSPSWMQERLIANGIRPINNMVDITNYVMLEYGQPMHAFDYSAVEGKTIVVRRAGKDKTITTLDGKERKLSPDMLLIADEHKPIGIAGVMGGENSQITEETKKVVLESALFLGSSIRHTSKELGLATDASAKFSKGIAPMTPFYAYYRALHLIAELGVGEIKNCFIDEVNVDLQPVELDVSARKINERTSLSLSPDKMKMILDRLQIKTTVDGDNLHCIVPYFRLDIDQMADISEEIARIYGYGNITGLPLTGKADGTLGEMQLELQNIRKIMCGKGFHEVVTYSFYGESVFDKLNLAEDDSRRKTVKILNPLGEDQRLMRTTMADSMLNVLSLNIRRNAQKLSVFDFGRVYLPVEGQKLPNERLRLSIGMYGEGVDFFALKGQVESLLSYFGIEDVNVTATGSPYLHPGRKCVISKDGTFIAELGEVDTEVASRYEIDDARVYFGDIDMPAVFELQHMKKIYRPIPRFPAVYRDLAMVVKKDIPALDLMNEIKKTKNVVSVKVFDVYEGEQVEKGKKSIAFSIVFQADDRTLNDKEIDQRTAKTIARLEENFGAELR